MTMAIVGGSSKSLMLILECHLAYLPPSPLLFFPLPTLSHFSTFCFCILAFSFPLDLPLLFYSLSDSIIMAKQKDLQYSCGLHFPCPFHCYPQVLRKYFWLFSSLPRIPIYFVIILLQDSLPQNEEFIVSLF